ncbi:MAG TPA: hypothetical protein VFP34_07220 [Microlunatus sp.]|nr:hypothetical protein [Microlunatus sp.]
MPKVSMASTPHQFVPGYVDMCEEYVGNWNVSIQTYLTEMDQAPFFKGAADDLCQAHHLGYVVKGTFGVRHGDGTEEIFEAGDAFVIEPGHTPFASEGCEMVAFTPAEEARQQAAVVMPNVMKYAQEQGVALPAEMVAAK